MSDFIIGFLFGMVVAALALLTLIERYAIKASDAEYDRVRLLQKQDDAEETIKALGECLRKEIKNKQIFDDDLQYALQRYEMWK